MSPLFRKSPASRRRRAFTLIEVLVSGSVSFIIVGLVTSFLGMLATNTDRQQVDVTLGDSARISMDEMLTHLRGASRVVLSNTVQGTSTETTGQQITFYAPGYDPATTAVILADDDRIAYTYDAQNRVIRQYIQPVTGSIRPSRNGYVIARNVDSVRYQFFARETAKAPNSGSITHVLQATPLAEPLVMVNGVAVNCECNHENRTVTFDAPARGADIQFLYAVQPSESAALPLVVQVDVEVFFSGKDGKTLVRRFRLPGSARLRNRRPE